MSIGYVCVPGYNPVLGTYAWRIVANKPFEPQSTRKVPILPPLIIEPLRPALLEEVDDSADTSTLSKIDIDHHHTTQIAGKSALPKQIADYFRPIIVALAKFLCPDGTHMIQSIPDTWADYLELFREGRYREAGRELVLGGIGFLKAWCLAQALRLWKFVRPVIVIF